MKAESDANALWIELCYGLRRLQERVKEHRLTHPGYLRPPFYFPVPGHFGISREKQ